MFKKIMPELKTIKGCMDELRSLDKDTAVSEWFIRQLCKSGKIDCIINSSKILVDVNSLIIFLGGKIIEVPDEE